MTTARRVLVTGGRGYLGGRVVRELVRGDGPAWTVAVTSRAAAEPDDDEALGVRAWDLAAPVPAELCQGVDAVVHLAAPNELVAGRDPEAAVELTVNATVRLLRAAREAGVRRFVFMSTAHVYGAPLAGPLDEATLPRPTHPYAIAHRAAEDFVLAARDRRELDALVIRLSNGFGAPVRPEVDRWTLLVNDLCREAATRGTLTLKTAGLQERDFVPLADVARAVRHLLEVDAAALGDGLINLGGAADGGSASTVLAMAARVAERAAVVLGRRPELRVGPRGPSDVALAPLRYRSQRLAATGFRWRGDVDAELDATLALCRDAFGSARA